MSVKMPVLGQPARRKSSGLGWVLFLGLAVAAIGRGKYCAHCSVCTWVTIAMRGPLRHIGLK